MVRPVIVGQTGSCFECTSTRELTFDNHIEWCSWQLEWLVGNTDADQCAKRTQHLHALFVCSLAVGGADHSMYTEGCLGFDCLDNVDFSVVQEFRSPKRKA